MSRITSYNVCYTKLLRVINDLQKQQLALEAAHKSIVLLKNDNALPLNPNSNFIYMTGPLVSNTLSLVGNYNGINSDIRITSYNVCYTKLLRSSWPDCPVRLLIFL